MFVLRKETYPMAIGQQRNDAHAIGTVFLCRLLRKASRIRKQSDNDSVKIDMCSVGVE